MRKIGILLGVAAALSVGTAMANEGPLPLEPAPWAALTSPEAAMKVAFEKVCLRAMMENRSVGPVAVANRLLKVDARGAGGTSADQAWRLASLGRVFVVAWQDGSCSSSSERGDPDTLSRQVLAAVADHGLVLREGQTYPAESGGRRVAWCSEGPQPWVLAIVTRREDKGRRPAIVTTLFRAKGDAPAFCRAA
ncbi:hypothetical protein [Phenylobacterium sp.]|uniref:hypothetical protein n=1 Tax=Phenylobacterium sp. TaxID=1871053 RepID=UPI002DF3F940|nr:hypothetical protein [Phenylobacterium sp.]